MNDALKIYADPHSADVPIDLPGVIDVSDNGKDTGVVAPTFEETKESTIKVLEQLADLTDEYQQIPRGTAEQQQAFQLLKQYNHQIALLKQDDRYDYDNPDALLAEIGISEDQEVRLTATIANELEDKLKPIGGNDGSVVYSDFKLEMEHVNEVEVDYDYLEELIAQFLNETNAGETDAADKSYQRINDLADQLDDRQYGKQIKRMTSDVHNNQLASGLVKSYPVKADDVKGILDEHNKRSRRAAIVEFRTKWGLVDAEGVRDWINSALDRHVVGNDDLNENNEVTNIITGGQKYYKADALDEDIRQLSKIKYRNELRNEFSKFADQINQEFKEPL
nr:hypothetical protein [Levilactobacillus tujiorum]